MLLLREPRGAERLGGERRGLAFDEGDEQGDGAGQGADAGWAVAGDEKHAPGRAGTADRHAVAGEGPKAGPDFVDGAGLERRDEADGSGQKRCDAARSCPARDIGARATETSPADLPGLWQELKAGSGGAPGARGGDDDEAVITTSGSGKDRYWPIAFSWRMTLAPSLVRVAATSFITVALSSLLRTIRSIPLPMI